MSNKTDLQRNNAILSNSAEGLLGGLSKVRNALQDKNVTVSQSGKTPTFNEIRDAIESGVTDLSDTTAQANDVATGKVFYDKDGKKTEGSGKLAEEIPMMRIKLQYKEGVGRFTSSDGFVIIYPTSNNISYEDRLDGAYLVSMKHNGLVKLYDSEYSTYSPIVFYEDKNGNVFILHKEKRLIHKLNKENESFELVWDGVNDEDVGINNVMIYQYTSFWEIDELGLVIYNATGSYSGSDKDQKSHILIYNEELNKFKVYFFNNGTSNKSTYGGADNEKLINCIDVNENILMFCSTRKVFVYYKKEDRFRVLMYRSSGSEALKMFKINNKVFYVLPTESAKNHYKSVHAYNILTDETVQYDFIMGVGDSCLYNGELYVFMHNGDVFRYNQSTDTFDVLNKTVADMNTSTSEYIQYNCFKEFEGELYLLCAKTTSTGTTANASMFKVTSTDLITISDSGMYLGSFYSEYQDNSKRSLYVTFDRFGEDVFIYKTAPLVTGMRSQNYDRYDAIHKYDKNTMSIKRVDGVGNVNLGLVRLYGDLNGSIFLIPLNNNYGAKEIYKYNKESELFDIQITTSWTASTMRGVITNPEYPNITIFVGSYHSYIVNNNDNSAKKVDILSYIYEPRYIIKDSILYVDKHAYTYEHFLEKVDKIMESGEALTESDARYLSFDNRKGEITPNTMVYDYSTDSTKYMSGVASNIIYPSYGGSFVLKDNDLFIESLGGDYVKKIVVTENKIDTIYTNEYKNNLQIGEFSFSAPDIENRGSVTIGYYNNTEIGLRAGSQHYYGFREAFGYKICNFSTEIIYLDGRSKE